MKKFLKIIILILLIVPFSAKAFSFDDFWSGFDNWFSGEIENASTSASGDSAQVHSEINVEASTGGNSVSDGGEVIEGKGKVQVETKTIINGQEVDSTQIEQEGGEVKAEIRVEAEGDKATVEKEIEIDGQKQTENKEVDLQGAKADSAQTETQAGTQNESGLESAENRETIKETFESVGEWWVKALENVKSFFGKIFGIL